MATLTKKLREMLEERLGQKVKCSSDCEYLAREIKKITGEPKLEHWYTSIPTIPISVVNTSITIIYVNTIINAHRLNEPMKRKCQNVNNAKG